MHGRIRKQAPLMAAMAFALVSAGAALGQSKPAGVPPRLLDDDRTPPREMGRDRDDRMRHDMGPMESANSDFPSGEVRGAVEANARAAFARANFRRLEYSLGNAIRQMQYTFDHSHDMIDALKAEQQAWNDYLAARNAALRSVVNDSKYQANVALKHELGEQIAEVRATYDAAKPTEKDAQAGHDEVKMKAVVNLATVKLNYAQVVTDMEVSALRGDAKVADARSRLMSAGTRVQALRDEFDSSMRSNQELAGIRRQIEDARIASITAESFRGGAVEAANQALDYAYYKNRFTYNLNNAYDYGYGYGYGTRVARY